MTIEKINDNQIRFILTGEDLAARQIRLSELAYGTDKARALFQEMMQQAASECGFEVGDGPLMIEAIPMHEGSMVLIVTRVEASDELDPRFASFSPAVRNAPEQNDGSFDIGAMLERLFGGAHSQTASGDTSAASPQSSSEAQEAFRRYREFSLHNRLYLFSSMDMAMKGAALLSGSFRGRSMLFREDGLYSLLLQVDSEEQLGGIQNLLVPLSEYGNPVPISYARQQYLEEHGYLLIAENAVEKLASFSE